MREALKAAAWIVGALLLLLAGAFAWGRLRPPTPAQAEALELMQPAPMPAGRNAWATLWLQDYDVPADQDGAAYARERAQVQAWLAQAQSGGAVASSYVPELAWRFARRPPLAPDDGELLCGPGDGDCLAKARANAAPLRAAMARQAGRLAALQALAHDDVLWDDMPASAATPLPAFGPPMRLLLTSPALDFVAGRQAQALDALCAQAATVRRLHAHTNSLVGAMVGVAWMDGIERELAGMLAELPAAQAVPASCGQAFAPVEPADVDLCAPLQREYAAAAATIAAAASGKLSGWRRAVLWLTLDPAGTRRLLATTYAQACGADARAAQLADHPLPAPPRWRNDVFDLVSNATGSILARIPAPAYGPYLQRNQDYAAGLRLTAWLLRHRADTHGAVAWQQRLQQALPSLQQGGDRQFSIDPDGRFVRMRYRARRPGHTELALPLAP